MLHSLIRRFMVANGNPYCIGLPYITVHLCRCHDPKNCEKCKGSGVYRTLTRPDPSRN